jgi:hypothetical protein
MNDREMAPLAEDVTRALAAERARPGVDAATQARLRARLGVSLASGSGGGSPEPAAARPDSTASVGLLRRMHPGLTAALGFAVGVATGVAAHSWLSTSTRADLARDAISPAATVSPPPRTPAREPVLAPADTVAPTEAPAPSAPAQSAAPVPSGSTLTAERALLDIAHSALARGEAGSALEALSRHAQRFPRGVYREEREALTVQALRAAGRASEAEHRAAAFKTRYPRSLFLSTVEGPAGDNP